MASKVGPWQPLPYEAFAPSWERSSDSRELSSHDSTRSTEYDDFLIPETSLSRLAGGVALATKIEQAELETVHQWFLAHRKEDDGPLASNMNTGCVTLPLGVWRNGIESQFQEQAKLRHLAITTLAVAFLHEKCRHQQHVTGKELDVLWQLLKECLMDTSSRQLFSTSRSAQGFLSVPLCSLQKNGSIDELYRLHVWLPDHKRGTPEVAIHAHQCFAQSWTLAGEGKDSTYAVTHPASPAAATHAEYALTWSDAKGGNIGTTYKTHQRFSVVRNTGRLVRMTQASSSTHTNGMSYTIPAGTFHTTTVAPDTLHATLFVFDAQRGFEKDAGVLGPKYKDSFTQQRDADTVLASDLAKRVDAVRKWERLIREGRRLADNSDMETALWAFDEALKSLEACSSFLEVPRYKHQSQGERARMYRRLGKYEEAERILESTIKEMGPSLERVELQGELAVLYSGRNQLDDSKRLCVSQYDTAVELKADRLICRAIGALGMVNYQLYLRDHDERLLDVAMQQQKERIEIALRLRDEFEKVHDPVVRSTETKYALTRASIGYARLGLCYEARGDVANATAASLESLKMAIDSGSSSVTAMSRYFYGRALLQAKQQDEALRQFNPSKTCTPAMALCMEPSHENRQYLQGLVDAGADMDLVDEHGYTALDYAVYNGNKDMEALLLQALRRKFESPDYVEARLLQLHHEAKVRRGYREIFQEQLRPLLLQAQDHRDGLDRRITGLRHAYVRALSKSSRAELFDRLRYVKLSDFAALGRLPRSDDHGIIQEFGSAAASPTKVEDENEFIIFISYRWIHVEAITMVQSPDDPSDHTQYKRTIRAVDQFLLQQPSINRDRVGIWIDSADSMSCSEGEMGDQLYLLPARVPDEEITDFSQCINQDNPTPGVSALPILLAQCNAVIGLIDETYYSRAWCSVEVAMVQQLIKSYGLHLWYEHRERSSLSLGEALELGPLDMTINMVEKHLTYESDRPKVLFLERQSRMLGRNLSLQY